MQQWKFCATFRPRCQQHSIKKYPLCQRLIYPVISTYSYIRFNLQYRAVKESLSLAVKKLSDKVLALSSFSRGRRLPKAIRREKKAKLFNVIPLQFEWSESFQKAAQTFLVGKKESFSSNTTPMGPSGSERYQKSSSQVHQLD